MRLIDADALKEWIDEYVSVFKKPDNKDIKGYIEHQPTIEPKRGEWIEMYRNGFGNMICMCSKCNFHATKSNFCPNCGADMREREGE